MLKQSNEQKTPTSSPLTLHVKLYLGYSQAQSQFHVQNTHYSRLFGAISQRDNKMTIRSIMSVFATPLRVGCSACLPLNLTRHTIHTLSLYCGRGLYVFLPLHNTGHTKCTMLFRLISGVSHLRYWPSCLIYEFLQ